MDGTADELLQLQILPPKKPLSKREWVKQAGKTYFTQEKQNMKNNHPAKDGQKINGLKIFKITFERLTERG